MKRFKIILPLLLLFALGFFLRFWPEVLAGKWPIGYDTFNSYAPEIAKFDGNFLRWFFSANLLYFLILPFYKIFKADPYQIVQIAGPIIYGLLVSVFYVFLKKYLRWSAALSMFSAAIFAIQLASLRISWDLHRNILGLIFLFPAIYYLEYSRRIKNLFILLVCSLLLVLSNQLVTVIWLIIFVFWLIRRLRMKDYRIIFETVVAVLPSIIVFVMVLSGSRTNDFGGHVIYKGDSDQMFAYFEAYLKDKSYRDHASTIWTLFWFNYKYLIFPALIGFWKLRKNQNLTVLTVFLLFGTFSSLVFGGYGLYVWDRWLFMLVIPFTIYAVCGLSTVYEFIKERLNQELSAKIFKIASVIIAVIIIIGIFSVNLPFINTLNKNIKPPFSDKKINSYLPPTMINNSVGYENIDSILECIDFLNKKSTDNAVILIDNRYRGLMVTELEYKNRLIYTYPWASEINQDAIKELREKNLGPVYLVWNYFDNKKLAKMGFKHVFGSGENGVYLDAVTYNAYKKTLQKNKK